MRVDESTNQLIRAGFYNEVCGKEDSRAHWSKATKHDSMGLVLHGL